MARKNFRVSVWDFEYEDTEPGNLPDVLGLVIRVLNEHLEHVRTIRLWRGDFGSAPPIDLGDDDLFVAYSAQAELTCFKALGWKFPKHIFDLHVAYLAVSNVLLPYNPDEKRKRQRKGLADACKAYGIQGWEEIDKKQMAEDIGNGLWRKYGKEVVLGYCEHDTIKSTELFVEMLRGRRHLPAVSTDHILHWSNYAAKVVAEVQVKGMPIDMPLWNLVQENKKKITGELLRRFDPSQCTDNPIFTPEGEFSHARFAQWLFGAGIFAWPRTETGMLQTDEDTWKVMSHIPGVEGLRALKDTLRFIDHANLPIGRDGRNRPKLFPFCTTTGRNAHAKSLFNAHAGMRSFLVFPPDKIGVYLDWRTQEVGIAAARSGDPTLMADYAAGDIYHSLAEMCGLTTDKNIKRWKTEHADVRQRMKSLQLAIGYGMGVPALARGLDRHPLIASEIIWRHQKRYAPFWQWRADTVQAAMLDRYVESPFGWPLRISTSPNRRALYNYPMQSGGSEMLRLAAWRLYEAGIIPCMLVHDAILLELDDEEQIEIAVEIMRQAGRDVCDGFEIGVDVDKVLRNGERYRDKRQMARAMWNTIMDVLRDVGVDVDKRSA
jgi:DNA polymerase I